eukprot:TRINITY_DN3023_c0_g1_i1.p1 TRINITY_DN3023_c0_g1~~TRINITY_DN3023_c0_g1_i1.p1  ORF type:complete len:183 (+),score=54.36 TRINITY_DN3023_c0_g1_i1:66-614(+)
MAKVPDFVQAYDLLKEHLENDVSDDLVIGCINNFIDEDIERFNDSALIVGFSRKHQTAYIRAVLEKEGVDVNVQDDKNHTALILACFQGFSDIVQLLLRDDNLDFNLQNNYGSTAFMCACERNFENVVNLLLEHRDKIDETLRDGPNGSGKNAYEWTNYRGHSNILNILKKSGIKKSKTMIF